MTCSTPSPPYMILMNHFHFRMNLTWTSSCNKCLLKNSGIVLNDDWLIPYYREGKGRKLVRATYLRDRAQSLPVLPTDEHTHIEQPPSSIAVSSPTKQSSTASSQPRYIDTEEFAPEK